MQTAAEYAADAGLLFMETSAKTAINVNELFVAIAKKLPKAGPEPATKGAAADSARMGVASTALTQQRKAELIKTCRVGCSGGGRCSGGLDCIECE